jgi:hypothetical protein
MRRLDGKDSPGTNALAYLPESPATKKKNKVLRRRYQDRNSYNSNCDSNGPTHNGLMPPPATLVKMSESSKLKTAKKKPGSTSGLAPKSSKPKRFCCRECGPGLGVVFKSKIELQHHQSGIQPLWIFANHRTNFWRSSHLSDTYLVSKKVDCLSDKRYFV